LFINLDIATDALLGFPIIRLIAYLMNVITVTRRTHQI